MSAHDNKSTDDTREYINNYPKNHQLNKIDINNNIEIVDDDYSSTTYPNLLVYIIRI